VCVAAALSDDRKLASRCCDVLVEALSLYPQHVQVWLNSLYAILQILASNSEFKVKLNYWFTLMSYIVL